jgi:maltose alpha-D-glucosyltransferase/alpha-amylase
VPLGDVQAYLIVLKVEYTEGEPDLYLLPVAFAGGERASQLLADPTRRIPVCTA